MTATSSMGNSEAKPPPPWLAADAAERIGDRQGDEPTHELRAELVSGILARHEQNVLGVSLPSCVGPQADEEQAGAVGGATARPVDDQGETGLDREAGAAGSSGGGHSARAMAGRSTRRSCPALATFTSTVPGCGAPRPNGFRPSARAGPASGRYLGPSTATARWAPPRRPDRHRRAQGAEEGATRGDGFAGAASGA